MKKAITIILALITALSITATTACVPSSSDVEVTYPAYITKETESTAFDESKYINEKGLKKAVLNEDGSVTITMTKAKREETVKKMEEGILETYKRLIDGELTPYIKAINATEDYRIITVDVEKEAYQNAPFDMTPAMLGISVSIYQIFTDEGIESEIIIQDIESGEAIETVSYPESF